MRCLEKNPEHRWSDADDLTDESNTLIAHSISLAGRAARRSATDEEPPCDPAAYLGSSIVVAAAARLARDLFALPDWVPTGAMLIMVFGLPVVLLTAFLHSSAPAGGPFRLRARRMLTWQDDCVGVWGAVGLFAVAVAVYAIARR